MILWIVMCVLLVTNIVTATALVQARHNRYIAGIRVGIDSAKTQQAAAAAKQTTEYTCPHVWGPWSDPVTMAINRHRQGEVQRRSCEMCSQVEARELKLD